MKFNKLDKLEKEIQELLKNYHKIDLEIIRGYGRQGPLIEKWIVLTLKWVLTKIEELKSNEKTVS